MRVLLAAHNCYTDPVSGAARSLRTMMEWLAEAGHDVRVLGTARFDVRPRTDFERHLGEIGVPLERRPPAEAFLRLARARGERARGRPLVGFSLNGVEVELLFTEHNDVARPDRLEYEQLVVEFERAFAGFRPDVVASYGEAPAVAEMLKRARRHGAATLYTVRSLGYERRSAYAHADHVLTTSDFISRRLREQIGLRSTGIPSPIKSSDVLAPVGTRGFVSFVNPAPHKGAALFARLADMLGRTRPDIPILVVQSAADASLVNAFPTIDFSRHPQIMAAPSTPQPKDFLALTRILLVPSVFEEPFGRVAAEAMVNGIPPLVSPRGNLPDTVQDGGLVLPLPDWMTPTGSRLPGEAEVQPWYDAVCALWDDPAAYAAAAARARAAGERLYGEPVLKRRYLEYFESLRPGGVVFDD